MTIPITDLVAGTNIVQIGSDQPQVTTNVNIVLVDVPGGVPILPGSNNAYPGSGTGTGGGAAVAGTCGSANGTSVSVAPTTNLCTVGAASSVSGTGPWSWSCAGSNGGATASCSANKATTAVNGVCGSANGTSVFSWPTTNLCSTGSASSVSGSGPFAWSCTGSNGGSTASCSALASTAPSPPTSSNCNLSAPAFCETFDQGPSAIRGRGGDLDPSRWATARLSGEILSSGGGTANPVPIAPIPACRAGITQTSVFPPNDTLICDANGAQSRRLMTAVSMQNYGVNSYMVRQPFDFAGRTGKIVFDASSDQEWLGGFIEIEVTEDPVPANTFRQFQNYEVGPVPRNGLSLKFAKVCPNAAAPNNTMVYLNYVGTIIQPTFNHDSGCAALSLGKLNRFEIRLSQNKVDVYGSDFSPDDGQTFPNFRLLYSANINLPFTRGYVHFNARNHASVKYGFGPDAIFYWDNIGFDGLAIAAPRAYEIPDNTTTVAYNGATEQNLGYQLQGAPRVTTPGIYTPTTRINSLSFQNVNVSGATSATLTLNAFFNAATNTASTNWGFSYRFNGGALRNYNLTAGDLASINAIAGAPLGMLALAVSVPVTDIVSGTNTLELLPLNAPMDYPPVVANIDLLLGASDFAMPTE